MLWIAGVIVLALRLLGGASVAAWIRRHATPLVDGDLLSTAARLRAEFGLTAPFRLLQSAHVEAPVVIGWRSATLVLPSGVLARVAPDALEPILAHEFAHVRRRDYLANLFQSAAELLLFFSPAIVWLSRRIRATREYCCDDVAVRRSGNPRGYIEALMTLASLATVNPVRPVLGASGPRLVVRVRRILEGDVMPKLTYLRLAGLAAALVVAISSGWKVAAVTAARTAKPSAASAAPMPGRAEQNGPILIDIPYGYGVRDGAGVEIKRLRHTADVPVQQLILKNVANQSLTGVRFVAVVERFPMNQSVEIVTSELVPTYIQPQAEMDLGTIDFPALRKITTSGERMQVFFSIQEAHFANNVVWSIVPNPAAREHREALGFEQAGLTRAFLASQATLAPNPQAGLCYDQNGKGSSTGAVVRIVNEPGHTAVCRAGRWEEGR